jgi:hypothetical protein
MTNKITSITRRNIWDQIQISDIHPYGRIGEPDLLGRIWNLSKLPSTDLRYENAYGDIFQQRVNNYDWDSSWLLSDSRINLLHCDDSLFLQFLCETIHPLTRNDSVEIDALLKIYNENLKNDGYRLIEKTRVSGKPIYAGVKREFTADHFVKKNQEIKKILSADYVTQQITLMESSIESSPHVSIGIAKELIETCCKSIFDERNIPYDKDWDLSKLMKETTKLLKLTPDDISNEVRAASSIKQILGSLSSVVQGIGEIRNEYGSGHGKDGKFIGLQPRHAKLAVGAASTLAIYLLETHELKK